MISKAYNIIEELVHRETNAWDTQNVQLLMSLFHPDMVWPWPPDPNAHDPVRWVLEWGRFDYKRWNQGWQELFDSHRLIHNKRKIIKITVSSQQDSGMAVVDIDTLWEDIQGHQQHWCGRVCKVYTRLHSGEWKMIMHTGVLNYT